MPVLRFYGKVLPVGLDIGTRELPAFSYDIAPGVSVTHVTRINHGIISVLSSVPEYKEDFLSEICKGAIDAARTAVDMIAFASGHGRVAQLEFIDFGDLPNGSLTPIFFNFEIMAPLCTAIKLSSQDPKEIEGFAKLYGTAFRYPALSMALGDLIQAATHFHIAAQNCGRVVEALRKLLIPTEGDDRGKSWPIFRDVMRVDAAYTTFITKLAQAPRHGDRTPIPGDTNNECIARTWVIMNRFLEYVKRGSQPLPESEFPILKG